ncbi:MAG: membrane protein insertion efficiency factor YidD [Thermoguttaceae bacterium]|nr:membrane protein insertion efficiency factor YidD [Thermoguttaceae bacterium]
MLNFVKKHKKTMIFSFLGVLLLLAFFFSRPLTYLALDFYDAYITPYNGHCAYRILNNSCSCSEYFRNIVDKQGVFLAILAMPKQFHRCNLAFNELKLRAQEGGSEEKSTMDAGDWCCLGCGIGTTACCATVFLAPFLEENGNGSSKGVSNNGDSTTNEYNADEQQDISLPQSDMTDSESYDSSDSEPQELSLPMLEPIDQ